MLKFFSQLANEGLLNNWAPLLDWIFNDNKFEEWTPNQTGKLTKRIKKLPLIGEKTYQYRCIKNLSFPKSLSHKALKVIVGKKDSEAKDWIRHLRNGIAHGNAKIIKKQGALWIEIEDFNRAKNRTAYFFMPLDYVVQIQRMFVEMSTQEKRIRR